MHAEFFKLATGVSSNCTLERNPIVKNDHRTPEAKQARGAVEGLQPSHQEVVKVIWVSIEWRGRPCHLAPRAFDL
jgi:hypothetical protein